MQMHDLMPHPFLFQGEPVQSHKSSQATEYISDLIFSWMVKSKTGVTPEQADGLWPVQYMCRIKVGGGEGDNNSNLRQGDAIQSNIYKSAVGM